MSTYNEFFESKFEGNNIIPATYGNVSLYTTGKTDLGSVTTKNLAINKNNTSYALDVSGNVNINGNLLVNGNSLSGSYVDLTTNQNVGGDKFFTGNNFDFQPSSNNPNQYAFHYDKEGFSFFGKEGVYVLDRNTTATPNNHYIKFTTYNSNPNQLQDFKDYFEMNIADFNNPSISRPIGTFTGQTKILYPPTDASDIVPKSYVDNIPNVVHLTGNETISSQKTFYLNYSSPTITNQYMRDFSNNGFAVPAVEGQTSMINQTGAYNITYSGWTFNSGAGIRNNVVEWWYGSNSYDVWWYQFFTKGAPPPLPATPSSTFTGNYALRFYSWAPSQSFYVQNNVSLTSGAYILTFYSYYGAYPGGANGSTTASITITIDGNVTQTYKYSDPETYVQRKWKLHNFFFVVPAGQTTSYIRWTPNELVSASLTFRWALAGISVVKYNGQQFQDVGAITTIGGSLSYLENPYLNNPVALNSLTCRGIPNFNLSTGASNLVLNTAFTNSDNAVSNIAVGYGIVSNSTTMTTNVLMGHNVGSSTPLSECLQIGQTIKNSYYRDILLGNFLRSNDAVVTINNVPTYYYITQNIYGENVPTGSNVVIGNFIGVDTGEQRQPTTGVGQRCVAIGTEQFGRYNGFGKLNTQPTESVSIGYRSQYYNWDNYNTSVGSYSLKNIDGNNNGDDGFGYPHTTQYNVAVGHSAGYTPRNANKCVFVGSFADMSGNSTETTLCEFSTALGYGAKVRGSYSTAIGAGVYCDVTNCVKIGRPQDLVKIDGSLNVVGNTTFTSLPTSSATPSTGSQLTTKTYVDAAIAGSVPSGVALLSANNAFTGNNTFSGTTSFTGDISANNVLISPTELSYLDGVTSNIQTQISNLNTNVSTIYGNTLYISSVSGLPTGTTYISSNLNLGTNNVVVGGQTISSSSFSYLSGVTSNIQTQLNSKQASGNYVTTDTLQTITSNKIFSGITSFTGDISANNVLISPTELSYLDGVTSNVQTQINGKQATGNYVTTDTSQTITSNKTFSAITSFTGDISANNVLISPTELSYLDGVSSNIQTQLNGKQASGNYVTTDTLQTITANKTFNGDTTANYTNSFIINNSSNANTYTSFQYDSVISQANNFYLNINNGIGNSFNVNTGGATQSILSITQNNYLGTSNTTILNSNLTVNGTTSFTGDISANNVLISPTELSYLDGVSSNIQTQLNGKQVTGNYVTTDTDQNIISLKSFDASANYGIRFTNGATELAKIAYDATQTGPTIAGTIWVNQSSLKSNYDPQTNQDLVRRYYVTQNYTTLSTAQTISGAKTFSGINTFSNNINVTSGNMNYHGMGLYSTTAVLINTNYVIPTNFTQFYSVQQTATAFTITLPTITASNVGCQISFRKVSSTGTATISFIGNGTQNIYPTNSVTGQTTAWGGMTSSVYNITFTSLLESGLTTFGWFAN